MLLLLVACSTPPPATLAPRLGASHGGRARHAHTYTVDCKGGADYADILDALHDAHSGDTITVAPCTYYGSIAFDGKAVTIESTGGAAVTTILASPGTSAVRAQDGEGPATVVAGFTISGGGGPLVPAIDDEFSALTLRDDILTGNVGTDTVYTRSGHVVLERVTIAADNTPSESVLVRSRRGLIVAKDTTVHCGTNGTGYISEHGAGFVDGGTFDCPGAIAVESYHCPTRLQRAVVDGLLYVENEGTGTEGTVVEDAVLLGGASVYDSDLTLRNTVSVGNVTASYATLVVEGSVVTGAACGLNVTSSSVTQRSNDFWNNTLDACGMASPVGSNGSFDADPKFVGSGDYQLGTGSPCADAGPTDAGYADPDGSRNDIGAYGGPLSLGGGW